MVLEMQRKDLKVKLEEVEKAKDDNLDLESKLEDEQKHTEQYKA